MSLTSLLRGFALAALGLVGAAACAPPTRPLLNRLEDASTPTADRVGVLSVVGQPTTTLDAADPVTLTLLRGVLTSARSAWPPPDPVATRGTSQARHVVLTWSVVGVAHELAVGDDGSGTYNGKGVRVSPAAVQALVDHAQAQLLFDAP